MRVEAPEGANLRLDEVPFVVGDTVKITCPVHGRCAEAWRHKVTWLVTRAFPPVWGKFIYEITTRRPEPGDEKNEEKQQQRKLVTLLAPHGLIWAVEPDNKLW